jgi:hypothetical protein
MASLFSQNIGLNYKGILNLNTLNGNLSGTLQAVTDGDGNASPLRLSTTRVDVGTFVVLGGTTNAFPAIKRNSAAIDFRLADDSAFCNISAAGLTTNGDLTLKRSTGTEVISYFNSPDALDFGASLARVRFQSETVAINATPNASAALTIASTTKGFLPPRMTTTQKNAIATPATGLVLYDTTLNKLAVYTGSAWETVTSI